MGELSVSRCCARHGAHEGRRCPTCYGRTRVGDTLRGARVKAGLSLKSAAAKAGTNLTTVHFIERGQRVARTNFIVIVRLVRLYGISLDTLADAVIAEHANG